MPYRLATPQYFVNGKYYSTVYGKKQAILSRFVKIEKVSVIQNTAKRLPIGNLLVHSLQFVFKRFSDFFSREVDFVFSVAGHKKPFADFKQSNRKRENFFKGKESILTARRNAKTLTSRFFFCVALIAFDGKYQTKS